VEECRLAEPGDRDVDGAAAFGQARLLEWPMTKAS